MRHLNKRKIFSIARNLSMKLDPYFRGANVTNSGQVMVYPQAKCVYNRIKKSANSSTTMFLADTISAGHQPDSPFTAHSNYHSYKHQSIDIGTSLSTIWRPDKIVSLKDYYWFTVVRNPYTRVLSAFLQRGKDNQSQHNRYQGIPGFDCRDPAGFKRFVNYLQNGGLYDDKHWWPQHKLLFLPVEKYDYIARTESLQNDLKQVLQDIGFHNRGNDSFSAPHPAEKSSAWKVTNANGRVNEFYDDDTRLAVFNLYKSDFEIFKYNYNEFK